MNEPTYFRLNWKNKKTFQIYGNCKTIGHPSCRLTPNGLNFDRNKIYIGKSTAKIKIRRPYHEHKHILYVLN